MFIFVQQFGSEAAEASGLAALGVDGKAFLIQFVTFVLVFFVLKKYAFTPIIASLEARRKTIEDGLKLTTEMVEERAKLEKEVAKIEQEARKESDQILASTRDQADGIVKAAELKAQAKADNMMSDAKKKIEEETLRARRSLEKDMVNLVVEATEFVAHEKIDATKDKKLIADALKGQS